MPLAVIVPELAWPRALVVALMLVDELEKARLAVSPVGAVKVTVAPGTAFPPMSVTVAINGFVNAVRIVALWPLPLVRAMFAGAPGVLVRLKVTDMLPAVAVTV